MLVLLRGVGKKLKIGDDVTLVVLGCQGGKVRIGIEAPKDVVIQSPRLARGDKQDKASGPPLPSTVPAPAEPES